MRKELNLKEVGGGASQAFCSSGRKDTTASFPATGQRKQIAKHITHLCNQGIFPRLLFGCT